MKINKTKIIKKLTPRISMDDLVRDFMHGRSVLKPKRDSRHVGIEVECFGPFNHLTLNKMVLSMDLERYIQIGRDGSITCPRGCFAYELRLLLPEGTASAILKRIGKLFKAAKLQVNSSCGLHVHLDMRSRQYHLCYTRLLKFQDLLYSLVKKERWRNHFCQYVRNESEFPNKYRAITGSSLAGKGTLEIRLHEGCVDTDKIDKWVKLLVQIVNCDSAPPVNKDGAVKWGKKGIQKYLKQTYNDNWLKEKRNYVPPTPQRNNVLVA
jgi:hypothetical protein